MRSALFRQLTSPASGVTGRYSRLTDIGIRIESGGRVALDTDRLRAVLQEDPEAVEALLTARQTEPDQTIDLGGGVIVRNPNAGSTFSSLGVMEQFARLADRYINTTDGIATGRSRGIDNQIALQNSRIDQFTARLEVRRGILEQQFRAMEQALGQLQQQQGALNRIGAAR
jgi:flagellar capping protein FliD